MGALEALEFLSRVVIRIESVLFCVQLVNIEAFLVNSSEDGLITFKLILFLRFYHEKKLIFLFDN